MTEKHHAPKDVSDKIALGLQKPFALLPTHSLLKDMDIGIEIMKWLMNFLVTQKILDRSGHRVYTTHYEDLCM